MSRNEPAVAYDWRIDAIRSFELWAAAMRERCIREGVIAPETPQEARWREEGPVHVSQYEAGR